jgi:hypothetical protein
MYAFSSQNCVNIAYVHILLFSSLNDNFFLLSEFYFRSSVPLVLFFSVFITSFSVPYATK